MSLSLGAAAALACCRFCRAIVRLHLHATCTTYYHDNRGRARHARAQPHDKSRRLARVGCLVGSVLRNRTPTLRGTKALSQSRGMVAARNSFADSKSCAGNRHQDATTGPLSTCINQNILNNIVMLIGGFAATIAHDCRAPDESQRTAPESANHAARRLPLCHAARARRADALPDCQEGSLRPCRAVRDRPLAT